MKIWHNPNESVLVDIDTIKCKKCGSRNFTREGGVTVNTGYVNGKFADTIKHPLPTRIFCNDCHEEIY